MRAPTVTPGLNSYLCHWADPAIDVEALHLVSERRHRLSAEVYVRGENGSRDLEGRPLMQALGWAHIELQSASGRETLWRKANRAAADNTVLTGVNWEALVDEGCRRILEASRQPKSVFLEPSEDSKLPPYLLSPLLRVGQPTIVYGDGGAGKGLLACYIATVLLASWQDNPLEWMPPDEPCPVLYLDWEADEATTAYRLACIQRGHDLQYIGVHYLRCDAPLIAIGEDVERIAQAQDIRAVIVDSLLPAAGTGYGDPAGPAKDVMQTLRGLGNVASVIIGHLPKPQPGQKVDDSGPYGSRFYRNLARQCWLFKSRKSYDSHELIISLADRKQNDAWGSAHPIGIRATFSEFAGDSARNITLEPCQVNEEAPELNPDAGAGWHILQAIKQAGPRTRKGLEVLTGLKAKTIEGTITRLADKGFICRVGQEGQATVWGLTQRAPESPNDDGSFE